MSDLTKWPRLLVTGADVTPEQADDILVRTANLYLLDGNDKQWTATVYDVLGLEPGEFSQAAMDSIRTVAADLGVLDLTLLYTSRIASTWIGGPHGWCDWDGRIGCANYNLGKWPDRETVLEDWQAIAAAFPYLDLTAQLIGDEGTGAVLGQWRVTGGQATEEPAGPRLTEPVELGDGDFFARLMPGGERGVSPERLSAAVDRVRTTQAARA